MGNKIKVYVAGALNSDACNYIRNLHRMIWWANEIKKMGFSVFIPGLDFLAGLIAGNWEYEDYFENSQAWLEVSDAMFLVPGWKNSKGCKKEKDIALEKEIPVFISTTLLKDYFSK